MTNDALKAKALEAAEETMKKVRPAGHAHSDELKWRTDIILSKIQPLIDADRQETERLKKALRFYADRDNYEEDKIPIRPHHWKPDSGDVARTALGEEK